MGQVLKASRGLKNINPPAIVLNSQPKYMCAHYQSARVEGYVQGIYDSWKSWRSRGQQGSWTLRNLKTFVLGDFWGSLHSLYLFPHLQHCISILAPLLNYCLLLTEKQQPHLRWKLFLYCRLFMCSCKIKKTNRISYHQHWQLNLCQNGFS